MLLQHNIPDFVTSCLRYAARSIRLQLRRLLQQCSPSAEILLAEDGGAALRILEERAARGDPPLDFLTMDREMPRVDGPSAIQAARRAGYDGLIVGISACSESERACMLEAGADVCLRKPVTAADVQAILALQVQVQMQRSSPQADAAARPSRSSTSGTVSAASSPSLAASACESAACSSDPALPLPLPLALHLSLPLSPVASTRDLMASPASPAAAAVRAADADADAAAADASSADSGAPWLGRRSCSDCC